MRATPVVVVAVVLASACGGGNPTERVSGSTATPPQDPPANPPAQNPAQPPAAPTLRSVKLTVAGGKGSISIRASAGLSPISKSCDSTCTIDVDDASEVSVATDPAEGFLFAGYGGACGDMSCDVVVHGDAEITASFSRAPDVDRPRFDVEVVTHVAGGTASVSALGEDGSISGISVDDDGSWIFVRRNGSVSRIAGPSGKLVLIAATEGGHFVGTIRDAAGGPDHAFVDGSDIGTLGGAESAATAVNGSGLVVGTSSTANGEHHAFAWSGGTMIDLAPRTGKRESRAFAVDDLQRISVIACDGVNRSDGCRVLRIDRDGVADLGTPPEFDPKSPNGNGVGVNLWIGGRAQLVEPLLTRSAWPSINVLAGSGQPRWRLAGVNDAGDAVGEICVRITEDCELAGALFFRKGTAVEIGSLTDSPVHVHWARAINGRGQILADTGYGPSADYLLLTPRRP